MAQPAEPGVLIYEGKSYAVGLLWFTVQEDTAKALLQQRVKKTHADFYCQRMHISQQQGFGWLNKGHKRGMHVAAAMIADQLVGEWHGVFEAENGWWYVQVRSDTITPTGDRFLTSEEEAYNLFQSEMQKHNWPHAYAPAKWRFNDANTRELTLKSLLNDFSTTKLVASNFAAAFGGEARRNLVLGIVGAVFIAMIGMVGYSVLHEDPIVIPAPKTGFVPRTTIKPSAVLAAPTNTNQFISPLQMMQQCGAAADTLMIPLPGWSALNFTCGSNRATLSWKQNTGTLSAAKEQGLKAWGANRIAIAYKGNVMTATLSLDKLPTVQPEKLPTQEDALMALEEEFQPLGALQIKPVVPPPPPAPARSRFDTSKPAPPPVAPPPYLDIQFLSGFGPEKTVPFLEAPGLEVQSVDWNIPRGLWQYKIKWTHVKNQTAAPAATKPVPGKTPVAVKPVAGGK